MAMGFGSSMLFARSLGADGNGEFVAVSVMVAAMVSLTSLGSGNFPNFAVGRFSDNDLQRNMLGVSTLCTALGVPIVLGICFWKSWSMLMHVPVLLLVLFVGLYNQAGLSFLQSKGDLRGYNFAMLGAPVCLLASACLTMIYPYVHVALGGFILGELMAFALTLWFTRQHKQALVATNTKLWAYAKQATAYGWRVQIVLFYTLLLYRGVIFIIDTQLSPAAVGVFAVALTIVEKSAVLSQAVAVASFSKMKDAGAMSAASLDRLAMSAFGVTLAAGIVLILAAELFIVQLLGVEYALVPLLVLLLLPGVAAFGAGRLYLNYILVNERMDGLLTHAFLILLVSFLLALLLLAKYQLSGVAIATSLAFIVFTIYLRRKEKFK